MVRNIDLRPWSFFQAIRAPPVAGYAARVPTQINMMGSSLDERVLASTVPRKKKDQRKPRGRKLATPLDEKSKEHWKWANPFVD